MSKTGQWVLGMQEDATWMTKEEFIKEHGINQVDIWEQIQNGDENYEPDWIENEEGFMDNDYGQQFQN